MEPERTSGTGTAESLPEWGEPQQSRSLQVEAWLKESSGQDCFVTAVRRSIIAEKATMQRVPLPKFSKNCIVTQDYRNVVTELLKDMEG